MAMKLLQTCVLIQDADCKNATTRDITWINCLICGISATGVLDLDWLAVNVDGGEKNYDRALQNPTQVHNVGTAEPHSKPGLKN